MAILFSGKKSFDFARLSKWVFYYLFIGIVAGLGSIVFHLLCESGVHFFMVMVAGYRLDIAIGEQHMLLQTSTPFNKWAMLFLPAAGGIVTTPSDDLNSVLQRFTVKNIDSLPVVLTEDHGILLGMLNRRDVISFYNSEII